MLIYFPIMSVKELLKQQIAMMHARLKIAKVPRLGLRSQGAKGALTKDLEIGAEVISPAISPSLLHF
ncbi:CBL-interacting serine/threonine-protein kinase 16 [Corchorus olitorius]|uniref:CBL-interacting serine/threonine-protein kinase 16 n=1 Tax=Corchorus olitorius TaxID=93759 RepID=A0A1R3HMK3_9ROSI|nr:CBL-interacting serine/threonine-protein kinase 16 [Corchorus olitorius]